MLTRLWTAYSRLCDGLDRLANLAHGGADSIEGPWRPSSVTPRPVNPSFSAQRAKQLWPVSAQRQISSLTLDSVKLEISA